MANSPSHRFGQIIGDLLEEIMAPQFQSFCDQRGLYLDKKGTRGAARDGKKVSWMDKYGNSHDLDFVIEKGGSHSVRGKPVAFIEAAWRRYTKLELRGENAIVQHDHRSFNPTRNQSTTQLVKT